VNTGTSESFFKHRVPDLLAVATLWLLILLAFWLIGPSGRVLAGGDLFSYFYPYWSEAARALHQGRLPLWNPYLFMGVPFLANSQVGVLYPPNWPLWWLLPAHQALHWSILLHLGLAASGVYVYGRSTLRLGRLGAWAAGAMLALGGYLGAQVEHINQLQALSWTPWLLLLYERAAGRRSGLATASLAAAVALVLLTGHTQSAFIVLLGLAVYGLVRPKGGPRSTVRWVAVWGVAVALGGALAAAQLLPTFELAGHSVRAGGLPFNERVSFSLSPLYLARALLPGYYRPVEPDNIEYVATIGVSGLVLLFVGGVQLWRRLRGAAGKRETAAADNDRPLLAVAILAGLGLFLALGLYNPLYLLLARFVPGFAHFRAPARWLALWAFGAAALAGLGVDALGRRAVRLSRRSWLAGGALLLLLLIWGALGGAVEPATIAGWIAGAALAAGLLLWRSQHGESGENRKRHSFLQRAPAAGLLALVLAELLLSARTLPRARATAAQAYTSLRPAAAHLLAAGQGRQPADRFLSLSELAFDPGDLPELRLIYGPQLSPAALYDLIVSAKHREVLSPNLPLAFGVPAVDGYDGGVLPLTRYLALQRAFLSAEEVSLDGRLRENLAHVPDGRWLSLLNVRYVLTDKVFDAWIDDVFYDLQFRADLAPGQAVEAAEVPPLESTALGLVSYLSGAGDLRDGEAVGEVVVGFDDGTTRSFILRAGIDTAEGLYEDDVAHTPATVGGHFWPGQPEGTDYVARLRWSEAAWPASLSVRATLPQGSLVLRGASLIDERTGAFQSLVLSGQGDFRLGHSGDVKVYENLSVLPRAFLVHRALPVDSLEAARNRMQSGDFDPTAEVVVEGGTALEQGDTTPGPEEACIVHYAPERVDIAVDVAAPGYLLLTDAHYPGWRAWVDGREVEVIRADALFRAVKLEPGRHRVMFAFQPASVRVGSVVSLVALSGLLGGLALCGYNRLRTGDGEMG